METNESPEEIPENIDDIPWKLITLTRITDTKYHAKFQNDECEAEGNLDLTPLNPEDTVPPTWVEVAQNVRGMYNCDVRVMMPEGSDPLMVHFRVGEEPWKPRSEREKKPNAPDRN